MRRIPPSPKHPLSGEGENKKAVGGYGFLHPVRQGLILNLEAGELLELFLVSAVCAVLAIRGFLAATGYPQLGGDGLHIAHMLWGGAFMLAAFILLFTFLNQGVLRLAALLAGVGFGTFIDELGKFLTADNNYFFQPAIGLIYVILIAVFLILRAARRDRTFGPRNALANALNQIPGSIDGPLDSGKRAATLSLLDQADPSHPLAPHLRAYIEDMEPNSASRAHSYFRLREWAINVYAQIVTRPRFAALFPALLLTWGISQAVALAYLAYGIAIENVGWTQYAQGAAMAATVACVAVGIWTWRFSRARSYRWYMRGALVSIFITQVFVFFHSQLAALSGLAVNVLTYATVAFVANLEAEAQPDALRRLYPDTSALTQH